MYFKTRNCVSKTRNFVFKMKDVADRRKGMFDDLLIVMSTDNGGPIYSNGMAGANNWPHKGGKMSNWDGALIF